MKNILFFFIVCNYLSAQTSHLQLTSDWKFKSMDKSGQFLPAKVPGTIHTDLFENGLIPHPFVGNNELELQWISDERWQYVLEFELTKKQLKNQNIDLVFEGLDTYAAIYLNREKIDVTDNAFRTWKYDVKKLLKKKNQLVISFLPTNIYEEEAKSKIPYKLPEGNRIFTRKAQFQYGWDWGPKYNTMGIWRPVYLEFWNDGKLNDVYVKQTKLSENIAVLSVDLELKNSKKGILKAEIYLNDELKVEKELGLNSEIENLSIPITIKDPKLWWTHNLGDPYLYEFKVQIRDLKGKLLDEKIVKKGIRTIELVTKKDEFGESFYFKINGEPVFMKGANYIPQSSFQSWVSDEHYEKLLSDVVESNMNMLRVWGGGIYEDDYFYELCDEKGILVWQDFMFACAMYPGDEAFLDNVKQEAIDNVKRLRNHSSIALWCGNNESSEGWHRWGWQDGRSEAEKAEIWGNYQKLFNGILPEIVKELTDLPYWETSPKFGRGDKRYISEGDAHDWWIWHDGHPFENLEEKTPRFMSEFGFQSFPSLEVIKFINGGDSTSISSEEFKNHQKHSRGFDIIRTYMERDFPVPTNEEDYVYVSQLVQAYGISKGIEAQRRNKPYTMGSLYWQLNDVWPAVSWSGIDAFGNWKPLQHYVKKRFDDVVTSVVYKDGTLDIYVINDLITEYNTEVDVRIINFEGKVLRNEILKFYLKPNESKVVGSLDLNEFKGMENQILILTNINQKYGGTHYLVKPKDLDLKKTPVNFNVLDSNKSKSLYISSTSLLKDVSIHTKSNGSFYFEEIIPDHSVFIPITIDYENFNLEEIEIKSLNDLVN